MLTVGGAWLAILGGSAYCLLVGLALLPAGGQATPMTYEHNGRLYMVVTTGGRHLIETPVGDEVIAYALSPR